MPDITDVKRRIIRGKDGKRYVLLSKRKRVRVKDNISERQLIQWLVKHLKPKRKKKVAAAGPRFNDSSSSYNTSVRLFDQIQ